MMNEIEICGMKYRMIGDVCEGLIEGDWHPVADEMITGFMARIAPLEELREAATALADNIQDGSPIGADDEEYMIVEFELSKKVAERFSAAVIELRDPGFEEPDLHATPDGRV